jgi:hypothetical protein
MDTPARPTRGRSGRRGRGRPRSGRRLSRAAGRAGYGLPRRRRVLPPGGSRSRRGTASGRPRAVPTRSEEPARRSGTACPAHLSFGAPVSPPRPGFAGNRSAAAAVGKRGATLQSRPPRRRRAASGPPLPRSPSARSGRSASLEASAVVRPSRSIHSPSCFLSFGAGKPRRDGPREARSHGGDVETRRQGDKVTRCVCNGRVSVPWPPREKRRISVEMG